MSDKKKAFWFIALLSTGVMSRSNRESHPELS